MSSQVTKLSWKHEDNPAEINTLLETLAAEYPLCDGGRGLKLKFKKISASDNRLRVVRNKGEVLVEYSSLSAAARGIGSAMAKIDGEEHTTFKSLGIMLDLSRGMVMRVEHFKKWLRRLALSGYNQVYLYCEDTYELEDEPFFGAFRGGYSLEDLREMDDYAAALGIELVGCIQTLAHLEHLLRHEKYSKFADSSRILLVGAPETEALTEKMIAFWSSALRSRRIHIGMDEAHGLGRGKYQDIHGANDPFQLMTEHLKMTSSVCRKYGLEPMIWSDMFFRLTNIAHSYYDTESPFPSGLADNIDRGTQLVYWDYYHEDEEIYRKMIARHRELSGNPVMASGIWTWNRLWYDHNKTVAAAVPCIEACKKENVDEIFFTMWGDDGAYCEWDSALAGIVFCGDQAYGVKDEDMTAERFEAICFADYEAQVIAADLHQRSISTDDENPWQCLAQHILWDDPLLGIYFDNCKRINPEFDLMMLDIYDDMLCRLMPHLEEDNAGNIAYAVALIKFIMRKLELRGALEAAYDCGDRLAVNELITTTIPAAQSALQEVARLFRKIWLKRSKANGMEVIQLRFACQNERLAETARRLREFLDGDIEIIDEMESRLPWSAESESINLFKQMAMSIYGIYF